MRMSTYHEMWPLLPVHQSLNRGLSDQCPAFLTQYLSLNTRNEIVGVAREQQPTCTRSNTKIYLSPAQPLYYFRNECLIGKIICFLWLATTWTDSTKLGTIWNDVFNTELLAFWHQSVSRMMNPEGTYWRREVILAVRWTVVIQMSAPGMDSCQYSTGTLCKDLSSSIFLQTSNMIWPFLQFISIFVLTVSLKTPCSMFTKCLNKPNINTHIKSLMGNKALECCDVSWWKFSRSSSATKPHNFAIFPH